MRTSPRQRQKLMRYLWFGLIGALCLLWHYNERASAGVRRVVRPFIEEEGAQLPHMGYCGIDDIALGTWEVERQFDDVESIKEAYKLQSSADMTCHAIPEKEGELSGLTEEEQRFKRIQAAATPSLRPRGGCSIHEAEPAMMLKRLLRSPSGMTIVGDSISQYSFAVLLDSLHSVSKGLLRKNKFSDYHYTLTVNEKHADVEQLVATAGITRARLQYPVVSFYRSDHLVTPAQLPEVMGEETWDRLKLKVQNDAPDWFPLWSKLLEEAHSMLPASESMAHDEPDLLVVNSGAHWNVGTMGYCEEEEFVSGYRKMFTDLSKTITQLPYPVAAYWRSLAPAHVDCQVLDTFNNARLDWSSPINGHMNQWNYQWYTWMNVIARRHTTKARSSKDWDMPSITAGKAANPVLRYMNVWDMSMKRPEAHLKPPKDCLHWCMVGVMNYWQEASPNGSSYSMARYRTDQFAYPTRQLLWNMIVEESKNDDYDVTPLMPSKRR